MTPCNGGDSTSIDLIGETKILTLVDPIAKLHSTLR